MLNRDSINSEQLSLIERIYSGLELDVKNGGVVSCGRRVAANVGSKQSELEIKP